jgi:putative hemolysin
MITFLLILAIVTLMIALNALYVAGEFAAVSARKSRVAQAAASGNRLARALLPVLEDHQRLDNYIAASQVGITLSSIVLGIYGQSAIAPRLAPLLSSVPGIEAAAAAGIAATLVLVILTTLQVVLGELVPKSLALQYPEKTALATVLPMRWSADVLLRPLIVVLNGSGAFLLRRMGMAGASSHVHVHSPEELSILVGQSYAGGLLDAEERAMLDNAFQIRHYTVADILVPRTRLVALSVDMPVAEAAPLAAESGRSRLLLYDGSLDKLVGFVHLLDLFRLFEAKRGTLRDILREAPYVPETMGLPEVWQRMGEARSYLAIVFDEYGGTAGIVTREDLLEELFGELQDEFDEEHPPVRPGAAGRVLIRADLPVVRVNRLLRTRFSNESASTIGGLVQHCLGRVPRPGDEVQIERVRFRVESVQSHAAQELSLVPPHPVQEDL